jgi:hypothetical protein
MGQPVAVIEKPSSRPGIVRFEANRNLTGMGHERYLDGTEILGDRPSAELARRLMATGKVDGIHIYLNMVTVDLKKGFDASGLAEIFENLYIYYVPGFVLPVFEDAAPVEETAAAAPADGPAAAAEVDPRMAALMAKSAAAKAAKAAAKAAE